MQFKFTLSVICNEVTLYFLASSDGVARLWNLENGTIEREYTGHQKPITALAYSDIPAKVES